ncbi:hypothetical protein CL622_01630 [archaeon]|nr:hypothetical protein [archaeon]|tara:strand:+ start:1 stop:1113 length:1113 start_codon:yes stop_codon:yes gene_type:complete
MGKEKVLQEFGLTNAEVKVYINLLEFGESTASEVSKRTGKNRTFTYDRLKKLSDFGLVSFIIKDYKKYFIAANPSQLLSILKEREERIQGILPELKKLKRPLILGPKVEVYSSSKGVKTALNLMLNSKDTIYLHGTLKCFQRKMPTHFRIWNQRRIKKKIHMRILSSENVTLTLAKSGLLSEEEKDVTSNFTFGSFTLLIMWGDYPVAVLIRSKEIAENNRAFFYTIWDREVKIYSGSKGIQKAFIELLEETKEFIGFGYSKDLSDVYTVEFSNGWHMERIKKKISCRIVAVEDKLTREYFKSRIKGKTKFSVRYLDQIIQGPACISLSDNMVVTFLYTEKKLRAILNRNKEAVAVYKKYFDQLWKQAKK